MQSTKASVFPPFSSLFFRGKCAYSPAPSFSPSSILTNLSRATFDDVLLPRVVVFEAHHRRLARWSILHAQNLASISNLRDKVDDGRRAKATVFPAPLDATTSCSDYASALKVHGNLTDAEIDQIEKKHPQTKSYDVSKEIVPRINYLKFLEGETG